MNTKGPSKKKKGRSKRAHVLVAAVKKATENFIEKGEQIAYENPDIKQEMLSAVEEVRITGNDGMIRVIEIVITARKPMFSNILEGCVLVDRCTISVMHLRLELERYVGRCFNHLFNAGKAMSSAAEEFADDPCSSLKRSNMVRAARNLLSAVTRLLILADMVDVYLLLKSLRVVSAFCRSLQLSELNILVSAVLPDVNSVCRTR